MTTEFPTDHSNSVDARTSGRAEPWLWIYIKHSLSVSVSWVDEALADLTWRSTQDKGHNRSPGRTGTVEGSSTDRNRTVGYTGLDPFRTSTVGKTNMEDGKPLNGPVISHIPTFCRGHVLTFVFIRIQ